MFVKFQIRKLNLFFWALLFCFELQAAKENKTYRFWVEFKDKIGTPYLINRPEEFLSKRALQRRAKAGVAVNWDDLPPNPVYIKNVKKAGVNILLQSRWMNAVLVETEDSAISSVLNGMATVKQVSLMGVWKFRKQRATENTDAFDEPMSGMNSPAKGKKDNQKTAKNKAEVIENPYGNAFDQIHQLNGDYLHAQGYRGKGVLIAVLDAGFYRAHQISAFDSLRNRGGVVYTYDFVDGNANVYNDDDHGTEVLSCMAANEPGMMIGTAPDAGYILLRTEDAATEFPSEEANWVAAVELADSMGVDIINASVGYTEFDMESLSHSYADLDGNTTLITKAANMAWQRGMFVITSAGNEGDGRWQYIGAPADAEGAIAVAAVDRYGDRAGFSSIGPTADSRVKPDLAAMGQSTTVASPGGYYTKVNGTSFSSPVLAGMIACAIQFLPAKSPAELRQWLNMCGSSFPTNNNLLGYGLPNFAGLLDFNQPEKPSKNEFLSWLPKSPVLRPFVIKTLKKPKAAWKFTLRDKTRGESRDGIFLLYNDLLYCANIVPEKSGEYELEVTDGSTKWKTSFEYANVK